VRDQTPGYPAEPALLVQFAGSGDAFGSGGRFQACIWLHGRDPIGRNHTMLVDCGASSLIALRRLGLDPAEIDTVVLSHLHGDHFGGVPFLILDAQFNGRLRPLLIAGPAGVRARVNACMEAMFPGSTTAARGFETRFEEISGDLAPLIAGGAAVSAAEVVHASGAPALALRIRLGGRIFAYSGDTEWAPALAEVSRGADLFACEAYTFTKKIPYHLDYATLQDHVGQLAARRIVLTHMSGDMLAHLHEVGHEVGLEPAHDGLTIEL
jgi:ribonuclease BN (tRNA processing enzyme)